MTKILICNPGNITLPYLLVVKKILSLCKPCREGAWVGRCETQLLKTCGDVGNLGGALVGVKTLWGIEILRFFDRCLGWEGICVEPNPFMVPLYGCHMLGYICSQCAYTFRPAAWLLRQWCVMSLLRHCCGTASSVSVSANIGFDILQFIICVWLWDTIESSITFYLLFWRN